MITTRGKVIELAVSPADELYWLSRGGNGSVQVTRWRDADDPSEVVYDEGDVDDELAMRNLAFAFEHGGAVVAWRATPGCAAYDTDLHKWRTHTKRPVLQAAADDTGGHLYFAHGGGVVSVAPDGRHVANELTDPPLSLGPLGDHSALVLTRDNRLWQFAVDRPKQEWLPGRRTGLKPAGAFAWEADGPRIVFGTANGIVTHDTVHRRYADLKTPALPGPMRGVIDDPARRWIRSGDQIYLVKTRPSKTLEGAPAGHGRAARAPPPSISTPIPGSMGVPRRIRPWENANLVSLMEDGRAVGVQPGDGAADQPRGALPRHRFQRLGRCGGTHQHAVLRGRRPHRPLQQESAGAGIRRCRVPNVRALGTAWRRLAAINDRGELALLGTPGFADTFERVCTGGFEFSDEELHDVRADAQGRTLVLAGAGSVAEYNFADRSITSYGVAGRPGAHRRGAGGTAGTRRAHRPQRWPAAPGWPRDVDQACAQRLCPPHRPVGGRRRRR